MIEITHLSKSFGNRLVLNNMTFRVEKGEVMGFLGPNGAGKSTTMNILTGYLSFDSGDVFVNGIDVLKQPKEAKKHIGYLPEKPPLYPNMTVKEYLEFVYELKGVSPSGDKKTSTEQRNLHIEDICRRCGIDTVSGRLIRNLSKGYKQRVGLAQALIGDPEVLILDEPTVGLDPVQIKEIRTLIKELGKEHTVILSSHILSEISAICEKVIIIQQGRIAAAAYTDRLIAEFEDVRCLRLRTEGEAEGLVARLSEVDGVTSVESSHSEESGAEIIIRAKEDVRSAVLKKLLQEGVAVRSFGVNTLSLEDIFLKYVGGESNESNL